MCSVWVARGIPVSLSTVSGGCRRPRESGTGSVKSVLPVRFCVVSPPLTLSIQHHGYIVTVTCCHSQPPHTLPCPLTHTVRFAHTAARSHDHTAVTHASVRPFILHSWHGVRASALCSGRGRILRVHEPASWSLQSGRQILTNNLSTQGTEEVRGPRKSGNPSLGAET